MEFCKSQLIGQGNLIPFKKMRGPKKQQERTRNSGAILISAPQK